MAGGSKNNNVLIIVHIVLFCTCLAVANSVEFNFPAVFNLGDSNSDTGELTVGLGFQLVPPYGQNYFKTPNGRACDGRLIVDFLSIIFILYNPFSKISSFIIVLQ
ncbi:putative alpha-L-fucosidase [Medicago truncatula]|uniref:Lipolytic enzyme, G-D-S-L n=1 Tax=Medicago truncatula TaxID=3880 RepID=Q2HTP1_MEDTR|nr:Lipolytic enzyme, G-D-S-L [Medicago truncatula]ABN09023.1 Lipolytic enzyme, G-D-S-L [Medicago truncatula]RHN49309.1 putative alpha-L-fucosidase [Medicago truncatula]